MDRTMLNDSKLPDIFQTQSIHTSIHILNRGKIRTGSGMTPYEVQKGRPTTVKNFRIFRRKIYIKRNDEDMGKFESKSNEGIFLGYATRIKKNKRYNLRMGKMVEI